MPKESELKIYKLDCLVGKHTRYHQQEGLCYGTSAEFLRGIYRGNGWPTDYYQTQKSFPTYIRLDPLPQKNHSQLKEYQERFNTDLTGSIAWSHITGGTHFQVNKDSLSTAHGFATIGWRVPDYQFLLLSLDYDNGIRKVNGFFEAYKEGINHQVASFSDGKHVTFFDPNHGVFTTTSDDFHKFWSAYCSDLETCKNEAGSKFYTEVNYSGIKLTGR